MHNTSFKTALGVVALVSGLASSGAASALTLNTTGLQANAVLTFSVEAYGAANAAAGIAFTPLANMTKLGDLTVVDADGFENIIPQFNLPVTKADISIGWDLKIKADAGRATRSVLKLTRKAHDVVLANFVVDFRKQVLLADFITPTGTAVAQPLYTFVEIVPQKISLKGLVLNQAVTIGKLYLPTSAQDALATGLLLSAPLKATLQGLDWGQISILVTTKLRAPVSDKPFTAADL